MNRFPQMLIRIINPILLIIRIIMEMGFIILIAEHLLYLIMQAIRINLVHFGIIITANTSIEPMIPPLASATTRQLT